MELNQEQKSDGLKFSYAISLASQLGFLVVSSIVGFLALGYYLDTKLGTTPVLLLIGIFVGIIASVFESHHLIEPLLSKKKEK